jgi:antitoxin (DNA-binding transcriptional repressor) of toxin-antitoxin stability system
LLDSKWNNKLYTMRSVSINEAKKDLPQLIDRALSGEQIAIVKDGNLVILTPSQFQTAPQNQEAIEAFRRLQATSRLTNAEAESYCRDLRQDRDTYKDQ